MMETIDVDIVRARLAPGQDLVRFAAVLNREEEDRASGYKVSEARDVFILARGLLRLELARRLDCAPAQVNFDLRPSGKPDLHRRSPSQPDWRFSVSHSGPHVALAFARGADLGIDIERVDRATKPLDIARRYFNPTEYETLQALPPDARTRAFFAGWTRKEAIVKARGVTMAESLTTLSVDLDPVSAHPVYEDAPEACGRALCRLTGFEIESEGLIGAVAVRADRTPRLGIEVLSPTRFD